ncbi:hypothetical protein EIP91_003185 [Steccherinum ochraceum]|uniref:MYND-type domain-containing protein n=1 Tax=Steccherinum ochraceum TaxID=92696 RepID=A0A4R0RWY1_9APHY|nr:hypothetical protein EIP91_003185 [Steccherinum ochraceum]
MSNEWAILGFGRFVHYKDDLYRPLFAGLDNVQAEHALHSFHCLYAAATGNFAVVPDPESGPMLDYWRYDMIDFSSYTEYKLTNVPGLASLIGLHRYPNYDEKQILQGHVASVKGNWKYRQNGILAFAHSQPFWKLVQSYHSPARTTGEKEWDELLDKIREEGPNFDRGTLPCPSFAERMGCLSPMCPFAHDVEERRAIREAIIEDRRATLEKPPNRDQWVRKQLAPEFMKSPANMFSYLRNDPNPEKDKLMKEAKQIRRMCANSWCMAVQWKVVPKGREQATLRRCSGCGITYYCSSECQKTHWKRHKADPCVSVEEQLECDDYWSDEGRRIPLEEK